MGYGLLLVGRTVGGGIEPLVTAAVVVIVAAEAIGATGAAGTTGTAGLTAGDWDTAFSTLTGSTGDAAATALFGRASSAVGTCGAERFEPLTAGDCRCSVCWRLTAADTVWRWRSSASLSTEAAAGAGEGRFVDRLMVTFDFGPPILIFGFVGPLTFDLATSSSDLKCI